jgi:hypothetical protein
MSSRRRYGVPTARIVRRGAEEGAALRDLRHDPRGQDTNDNRTESWT